VYAAASRKENYQYWLDRYDDISYLCFMKVTAIIADDLINSVKAYTQSSTVTEAITIALKDWVDLYNIKELNKKVKQNPINIADGQSIREINRSI